MCYTSQKFWSRFYLLLVLEQNLGIPKGGFIQADFGKYKKRNDAIRIFKILKLWSCVEVCRRNKVVIVDTFYR